MAIGRPIEQTPNIADKVVTATATAGQTQFTVTGGYRINHLAVFRNGVRLVNGNDYTALDGTTITLMEDASNLDVLEFQVFDTFSVSDALLTNAASQTVNGDVTVNGTFTVGSGGIGTFTAAEVVVGIVSSTTGITTIKSVQAASSTTTGALQVKGGVGIGKSLYVGGNVSVGGTLTYEDVTNVDSVGLVTAGLGLRATAGGLVVTAGVSTFVGFSTFKNDIYVAGVSTFAAISATTGSFSDDARFDGDIQAADTIVHTGDTNTKIRFPAADTVTVETAGSERLRVDSNGNIGVGNDASFPIYTDSGDRTLILGSGSDDAAIQLHSGTDKFGGLYFGDATSGGARYQGYVEYKHDDDYLRFATGGAEKLRITSAGLVGINQDTPTAPLHVKGTDNNTTLLVECTDADANVGPIIELFRNSASPADNDALGRIDFRGDDDAGNASTFARIAVTALDVSNNSEDARLDFIAATNDTFTPTMSITGEKVGIGTDTPVGNLEIRDSSKANLIVAKDGLTVKNNSDLASNYDIIQIGAGGALASYNVETATASTYLIHNAYRDTGNNWKYRYADTAMRLRMNSPGRAFIFESAASGSANANITYSEYLRIDSAGNVGINSADPGEKLDVNGTIRCLNELKSKSGNDLLLNAGSANRDVKIQVNDVNMMYVQGSTGNVGINTTAKSIAGMTKYLSLSARNVSGGGAAFEIVGNRSSADQTLGVINWVNDASNVAQITAKYQGSTSNGSLQFFTSGTEKFRIASDGKVGFNQTPSATATFSIKNISDSTLNAVEIFNDNGTIASSISQSSAGDGTMLFKNSSETTNIMFRSNGVSYFNGGDLAVGNNSPSCRLHVTDTSEFTAFNSETPSITDCMLAVCNTPPNETASDHATIQFNVNGGTHNRVNSISAVADSASNRKMSFVWCLDNASNRSERMRLTADGQLMLGRSVANAGNATGLGMEINGNSDYAMFVRSQATTLYIGRNNDHGTIVQFTDDGTSVGSVSTNGNSLPSDRNYKKNINSLSLGLNLIEKLNPVSYNYKFEKDGDPLKYGLIAQDLEQSLEEVGVEKDSASILQYSEEAENDPNLKNDQSKYNLCYEKLIPVLINSVKELKAENDELKSLIKNSSTFAKLKSSL